MKRWEIEETRRVGTEFVEKLCEVMEDLYKDMASVNSQYKSVVEQCTSFGGAFNQEPYYK